MVASLAEVIADWPTLETLSLDRAGDKMEQKTTESLRSGLFKCRPKKDINWDELDKRRFLMLGGTFMMCTRVLTYPAYTIKTRLQSSLYNDNSIISNNRRQNARSVFAHTLRTEGIRGLFRGFLVTSASALPAQALYYSTYEIVRSKSSELMKKLDEEERNEGVDNWFQLLMNHVWSGSKRVVIASHSAPKVTDLHVTEPVFIAKTEYPDQNQRKDHVLFCNLIAGAASSLATQSVVIPTEVVSQRMIIENKAKTIQTTFRFPFNRGVSSIIRDIYAVSGLKGFYRGAVISASTYATGSAIWWISYTAVKQKLCKIQDSILQSDDMDPLNPLTPFRHDIVVHGVSGFMASATSTIVSTFFIILSQS